MSDVKRDQGGGEDFPAEVLAEAIGQIYRNRMTTTSGGNFSLRDKDDPAALWITPAGEDKGRLQVEDMVKVLADAGCEGVHRPSSEFPIHRSIYRKRPDVQAVIHAHPPALVAYALARKSPDLAVIPQIDRLCASVGYADYRLPGSDVLGDVIADEFENGSNVVVMENHGVAVAGSSMSEALHRLYAAEFCAQAILDASILGGARVPDQEGVGFDDVIGKWEDGGMAAVGDLKTEVDAVCHELAELVQRACDQGLMSPSYGSVSKRVKGEHFVISPHGMSRPGVIAEDFIWMCGRKKVMEQSGVASLSWALHEEIFRAHPDVESVIITQSPALMAHAVAHQRLDVTTNPESWVFVREVGQFPYGSQFANADAAPLVQAIHSECPALLIDNEAIVVTGGSLMQTFDRLEVSEFTAKSILLAKSIGSAVDMEPEKITELRNAFCE